MRSDIEQRQIDIILDNGNVTKTNEAKNLLVFVLCIVGFIWFSITVFGFAADIYIDKMSTETQIKIENAFGGKSRIQHLSFEDRQKISKIEDLKSRIVDLDESLNGKSSFPIYVIEKEIFNAFVYIDGTIVLTRGFLKKNLSEQEIAFVLAHEIGHYVNRDHLKSQSRQIFGSVIAKLFGSTGNIATVASELHGLSYSRHQENRADLYAGKKLIQLYGTNKGGQDLLDKLEEEVSVPEYLVYFSTHPSNESRKKLLIEQNSRY